MKKRTKGFTLAELLIVVAIIAVLVAIAIPVFGAAMEKSRAAVCMANRRSLLGQLTTQRLLTDAQSLEEAAGTAEGAQGVAACVCPSGGRITVNEDEICCSVHAAAASQAGTMLDQFTQIADDYKSHGMSYKNNDLLRKYYYNTYHGWPELHIGNTTYYIQPYYEAKSGDVYLFANTDKELKSNWNAKCFYDSASRQWYTGSKNIMFANRSWTEIQGLMEESGWSAVEQ